MFHPALCKRGLVEWVQMLVFCLLYYWKQCSPLLLTQLSHVFCQRPWTCGRLMGQLVSRVNFQSFCSLDSLYLFHLAFCLHVPVCVLGALYTIPAETCLSPGPTSRLLSSFFRIKLTILDLVLFPNACETEGCRIPLRGRVEGKYPFSEESLDLN